METGNQRRIQSAVGNEQGKIEGRDMASQRDYYGCELL